MIYTKTVVFAFFVAFEVLFLPTQVGAHGALRLSDGQCIVRAGPSTAKGAGGRVQGDKTTVGECGRSAAARDSTWVFHGAHLGSFPDGFCPPRCAYASVGRKGRRKLLGASGRPLGLMGGL